VTPPEPDAALIADAALGNGGGPVSDPQDHGFMYGRSFADPDGHIWEVMWMDPAVASGEKAPGDA
jgi:predicted lactoylglutathione lyase